MSSNVGYNTGINTNVGNKHGVNNTKKQGTIEIQNMGNQLQTRSLS